MARIPYPDPAQLSPTMKTAIGQTQINVTRMLAGASEAVFSGFGAFAGAFYTGSKIPPVLREIAILRVGYLCNSRYETFQHEALARHLKLTMAQIEAIRTGGTHPNVLNPVEQAVLDFAGDMVKNVRVDDATLNALRKHLPDQQVIDLILVIGCYTTICFLLETTGVELDGAPIEWDSMDITKSSIDATKI
jgi:4-carboxymuconolactone decarboxylase